MTSFGPTTCGAVSLAAGFAAGSVAGFVVGGVTGGVTIGVGDATGGVAVASGVAGCAVTDALLALAVSTAGALLLAAALWFSDGAEQLAVHTNNRQTIQCDVLRDRFIVK